MIRTFDFVFLVRRNVDLRNKLIEMMSSSHDQEMDIQGWHLYFDQKRRWITITNNGTDKNLQYKFVPAEIDFFSLMHFIDSSPKNEEYEYQIRYL